MKEDFAFFQEEMNKERESDGKQRNGKKRV